MERWPALRRARPHLVAKLVSEEGEEGGGQMRPLVVLGHSFTATPSPPQLVNLW